MTAPLSPPSPFDSARQVADAVVYEGYVLYPYRASSRKNQSRWQFGVLMPPAYVRSDDSERSESQTEVVFEPRGDALLQLQLRFLHLQHRSGGGQPEWDETVERQLELAVPVAQLGAGPHVEPFAFEGGSTTTDGVRRVSEAVAGAVRLEVSEVPGPFGALRLTVRVENRSPAEPVDRDQALRTALVAVHVMCALSPGHFLSMTDPPEWARPAVEACANVGTWPVLAGPPEHPDAVLLSSPIILEDHPQVAPESAGDFYDATEIDEILTLRTMALTDAEKAEARATDPRAAAVIDQADGLPQEHLDRLHGALRYLRRVTGEDEPETFRTMPNEPENGQQPDVFATHGAPWWDPGADSSVAPETDHLVIGGVRVARGSRVRLRPGARRTDAQDLFLRGRTATVEVVLFDVDGEQHLGVTPDDDEELAELTRWHGRYLYFAPDEVEPLGSMSSTSSMSTDPTR
jgi:hypothetical protein